MLGCSERPVNHSDLFWADKPVIAERRVVDEMGNREGMNF